MKNKKANRGKEAFWEHYQNIFGTKWADMLEYLNKDTLPVLRFSEKNREKLENLWKENNLDWQLLDWHKNALLWPQQVDPGTNLPGFDEHLFYPMNASSLLPVLALDPQPGEKILDACAAPGGKTLFIHDLSNEDAQITANDLSIARFNRMKQIFKDYQKDTINIWHKKAEIIFKYYPEHFDKILVDAPCSSEKHVLNSNKHLQEWSKGRIKQLSMRQIALISGLILALKPGGTLVYSTCALTPEENEMVVNKILKKKKDLVKLIPADAPDNFEQGLSEYCDFPPKMVARAKLGNNLNPIFVAKFQKL